MENFKITESFWGKYETEMYPLEKHLLDSAETFDCLFDAWTSETLKQYLETETSL